MKKKEQTPGILAIIKRDNKFLFTKRSSKSRFEPGKWGFVGEALLFGEDIIDGLKRGIKEEVNLDLKSWDFFNVYSYVFDSDDKTRHTVLIAYICECEGEVRLNRESEDYKWFTVEEGKGLNLIKGNDDVVKDLEKFFNNS
ncbi:MAG: NUDIX domain-containing protein [Candidatus Aenigmarchaeota archaeon]|nr:NUDIX domain-containing protein [Candidatus Aenigmarchaeota archaeon]